MYPTPVLDEKELLLRLRQGDERAFTELYTHYHDFLLAFAFKLSGDEQESMDIVQEIFVNLWANREKLDISAKLFTYLYQAVRYGFLYSQRKKHTQTSFTEAFQHYLRSAANPIEDHLLEKELITRLEKLADGLPGKMGEVFLMTHFQHYSTEEIAEALHISPKTVKNLLSAAMKNMKVRLGLAILLSVSQPLSPSVSEFSNDQEVLS